MAKYPITFIGFDGQPTDDFVAGAPCIKVGLFYDADPGGSRMVRMKSYWALLDTGADHNYADPTVLAAISASVRGRAENVNGEGPTSIYSATVVLQDPQTSVTGIFISRDFRREGPAPYLIVLGRSFLQIGHLNFDLRHPQEGCYFHCDLDVLRPKRPVSA